MGTSKENLTTSDKQLDKTVKRRSEDKIRHSRTSIFNGPNKQDCLNRTIYI